MDDSPNAAARPLEMAVVGAGMIGREHAARIYANPRCRLAAIVDPAPLAGGFARGFGITHFPSVEAMLAVQRIDGAVVATPNECHVPAAVTLLRSGVALLVEKPVADTFAAGLELVCAAEQTGVPVLIGHHRRHSPLVKAARKCIAGGTLGRIAAVNVTTLFHKPAAYFDAAWRRSAGGGPILINLIHDIDTLRTLAGEIVAVQAAASNRVRGFEVEDTAAAVLEFASGAMGTVLVSDTTVAPRSWEQTSGENPLFARDQTQSCIFVSGVRGSLSVPDMRLWRQDGDGSWSEPFVMERLECETGDPLTLQMDHFCDVAARVTPPLVSAADALRTLAVTLAVRDAARSQTRIEVLNCSKPV